MRTAVPVFASSKDVRPIRSNAEADRWAREKLALMTLAEKISLMSGRDLWSTAAIERLNVPSITMTDGPNGVRGAGGGVTSTCFPSGAAMGASWNRDLVEQVGSALGIEARAAGAHVLLGPTVNLQRTSVSGRNFECFSEDPLLTAELAVAFVAGVQKTGIGACIKHFIANDCEHERFTISSEVSGGVLREAYLAPFEDAVRRADVAAVMGAYNRVNGTYACEHDELVNGVLKKEWGFAGPLISDWGAAQSTEATALGGLDLEMPGPARVWGDALVAAVREGRIAEAVVDDHAQRVLRLVARTSAGRARTEGSISTLAHTALARRAAVESMCLLKNAGGVLPLDPATIKSIAIVGPKALSTEFQGGGSSRVSPPHAISVLEGIRERLGPGCEIIHEPGCWAGKYTPLLEVARIHSSDGARGLISRATFSNDRFEGEAVLSLERQSKLFFFGAIANVAPAASMSARMECVFTPETSGEHLFGLMNAGRSRLYVNKSIVIDNWETQEPGDGFYGFGGGERRAAVNLIAGQRYDLRVDYARAEGEKVGGVRFGVLPPIAGNAMERAIDAARRADATIVVVGSDGDWETEGSDRADLTLPGEQDALVSSVLAAAPDAIVIMNAGGSFSMPWFDKSRAVLWSGFGGQEHGAALASVIFGDDDPGGRMTMTLPQSLKDAPASGYHPGTDGMLVYGEGLDIGYRWWAKRGTAPLAPFGHGLSYAAYSYSLESAPKRLVGGETAIVRVEIRNVSDRGGTEVLQLYVAPPPDAGRPAVQLGAFQKVSLASGERAIVELAVSWRAFSRWDAGAADWRVAPGLYQLRIGRSAADTRLVSELEVCE